MFSTVDLSGVLMFFSSLLDIQSKYPDFGRVEKKYLKKIKK
jgi:hypothetical protein